MQPTNGDPLLEILGAYADRIPRAMPYCFQRSMRLSCCKIALFAMCIVSLNYVDSGNREKHEWCREVIRHIAGCGFDIATHLYEMTGYQWRRRWVAADPLTCISLRQTNSLVCSSNLEVLSKIKECRAENASIHYGDELVLGRRPTVDWVPFLINTFESLSSCILVSDGPRISQTRDGFAQNPKGSRFQSEDKPNWWGLDRKFSSWKDACLPSPQDGYDENPRSLSDMPHSEN